MRLISSRSTSLLLILLLSLSAVVHPETIQIAPGSSLFASMQSTFDSAKKQTSSLDSLFNMDSFFSKTSSGSSTTGNNIVEGSGNQMQGYNNRLNG
jgi:ABC-type uncharacterized transport system substrate-binding protein